MSNQKMDLSDDARGAPDWRPVRGEPDWRFDCYRASPWPRFISRLFDLHKLQREDQRFESLPPPSLH